MAALVAKSEAWYYTHEEMTVRGNLAAAEQNRAVTPRGQDALMHEARALHRQLE